MYPLRLILNLLLGAILLAGCGDDGGSGGDDNDAGDSETATESESPDLTCSAGEFKTTGVINGNPVNVTAGADGRYIVNTGDGTFVGSNDDGTSISLYWAGVIPNGQIHPLTGGNLDFATPIGGIEEISVIAGTIILDDKVEFELTELSLQDGTPVTGSLSGCHYK